MSPRISVVLPFRDAAATLDEALESVLGQEDADLELLCVDDGSRDEGATLVARRAGGDARVRLVHCEGRGLVAALNTGLRHARGALIARMDADDLCLPGRFAAQVEALEQTPSLGLVATRVEATGVAGEPVGEGLLRYVAWQNSLVTPQEHARELFVEAPLCHPSVMMRRDVLLAVHGYREVPWPEDYDLWLRLWAAGIAMAKVPRVLLSWRHRPGRATFGDARYAPMRFYDVKAEFLAPLLHRWARPVWIWGAGPTGKRLGRALERHGVRAEAFVDIDPRKLGGIARGAPIVPSSGIVPGRVSVVAAVGSAGARAIIREALLSLGMGEGKDFVCAA